MGTPCWSRSRRVAISGIAGYEHGLVGLRPLRVMEDVDHLIQIVLELAVGTEGAGIDGHEEVADVVWVSRTLGEPPNGREGGPGEDAPENMHHHREAVALVAAHLARAPPSGVMPPSARSKT